MVAANSASSSLSKYLKERYQDGNEDKNKKKKRKKAKPDNTGVLVVDEDPIWQKPVKLEEEDNDSVDEERPQVDEDIEVKRMKRLEQLRSSRPFGAISEDGSGWVSISDTPKILNSADHIFDISPPRRRRVDTPSPENEPRPSSKPDADISPPRKQRPRNDTPPVPDLMPSTSRKKIADLSLPCKRTAENDSSSPEPEHKSSRIAAADLPPPRRHQKSSLPEPGRKYSYASGNDLICQSSRDISAPYRRQAHSDTSGFLETSESGKRGMDFSPPRRQRERHFSPSPELKKSLDSVPSDPDLSPPRRGHQDNSRASLKDLSPPRKVKKDRPVSDDLSAQQASRIRHKSGADLTSSVLDLSPPRKKQKEPSIARDRPKTGLVTGEDIKEEISKTKKEDWLRFKEMDPSISGRGAEPIYRDKVTGERMSKDEFLKSHKKEEKPKEVKLEWGKGLAQKREAEARLQELEHEKEKPFARRRDDPDLDRMLKDRVRWGDPMAHLIKKKQLEAVLPDLGDDEKMKESGFIIPQEIPIHSWIRRGSDAAPNRYGIKPGRHWDGVDRSNGYEKQMFKRMNEKQATEREAYLWSVSDM